MPFKIPRDRRDTRSGIRRVAGVIGVGAE